MPQLPAGVTPVPVPPARPIAGSRGAVLLDHTPVVHTIEPAIHDLHVPRMHPCQAKGIGPGAIECGATPASYWRRWCLNQHQRDCWLCPVHAQMVAAGTSWCSDCAARGVAGTAYLKPLDLLLLDHAAEPRTGTTLRRQ